MTYKITVQPSGHQFDCEAHETVLEAALRHGLAFPYSCRNGACGSCKGKVQQGNVEYHGETMALTQAERDGGIALFCRAYAASDLMVEVREVGAVRDIPVKILPCRVQKKEQLAADVVRLFLKLPQTERLQFLPGQYIDILLQDGRRRSFSLANAPHEDALLELHIRHVAGGEFTQVVFDEMKEKALLRIEGPLGSFFVREDSDRPIIFMAGGTGFAPVKAMVEHLFAEHTTREIYFYWGARNLELLYLRALPESWMQTHSNFHFVPVLSEPSPGDAWQGRTGLVHEAIAADFPDLSQHDVYACGPPAMVKAAHPVFNARGLPDEHFYSDAFEFNSALAKK